MKTIKYVLAAALLIGGTAQIKAQDVNPEYAAVTKAIVDNKDNLKAAEPTVKDFVKEHKKDAAALSAPEGCSNRQKAHRQETPAEAGIS